MAKIHTTREKIICNECNEIWTGANPSICPKCWSKDTQSLKEKQEDEFENEMYSGHTSSHLPQPIHICSSKRLW